MVLAIINWPGMPGKHHGCLGSQANFIYGREKADVRRHVTSMPVLIRPKNNFLGQFIGSVSDGKYKTVNNTTSGEGGGPRVVLAPLPFTLEFGVRFPVSTV